VSDLTEIDAAFGDLPIEQQYMLRGAFAAGEAIETHQRGDWRMTDNPTWDKNCKYRKQPTDREITKSFRMDVEAFENRKPDFAPTSSSRRKRSGMTTVEMTGGYPTRITWVADEI
jgi:hypothetical protein